MAALAVARRPLRPDRHRAGLYPKLVAAGSVLCVAIVVSAVAGHIPRTGAAAALAAVMFAVAPPAATH